LSTYLHLGLPSVLISLTLNNWFWSSKIQENRVNFSRPPPSNLAALVWNFLRKSW
jgi:hypothetical protein